MIRQEKLGQFKATAICGNDISSSCLYVSAISIGYAGQYAWVALLLVSVVLYFFRKIYGEAVGALPLNGGVYNVLLNTSSKGNASLAAGLTILSYMATAVLSATEAIKYLDSLVNGLPIVITTIGLMGVFLVLTLLGITESARVALAIFVIHLATLSLLVFFVFFFIITNGFSVLRLNFSFPVHGSITTALFFGFSAAMLGISGFESSANYVEEQARGVFHKTLRNMWAVVTVFNPLLAFLALCILPMGQIDNNKATLLSAMGDLAGGSWLAYLIAIDAAIVLSGAVLTSFIGVSGLLKRMTLDRVWPQFLLKENRWKSNYRILIVFFLLCFSILMITEGELEPLAGVYTISFLLVMAFFAIGNILLKVKRAKLPRPEYAGKLTVVVAMLAVFAALYGNIRLHPEYLVVFLQYFVPTLLVIYAMLNRNIILTYFLSWIRAVSERMKRMTIRMQRLIKHEIDKLHHQQFVYFTKGDDIAMLNKVLIYVQENEFTNRLKIVTVTNEKQEPTEKFLSDFKVLDSAYPEIHIEFITLQGIFGPELIEQLSRQWNIPRNFMFICAPGNRFPYRVEELGGVRVIM
jgi:amino acid transporter